MPSQKFWLSEIKLKRKESKKIKDELDKLLNLVIEKEIDFNKEKEIRKLIREYQKKFGFKKEEIVGNVKRKIQNLLKNAPIEKKPEIKPQYAQIIIVEEITK